VESWQEQGAVAPLNFILSDSLLSVKKLTFKNTKLLTENLYFSILEKFRGKIKILSTHNLFCRKIAAVCEENCNFLCLPTF